MKKKYPISLFLAGFMLNLVIRHFFLFVPSLVLLIIGIWSKPCLILGIAILLIDIVVSLISQIKIRNEMVNSDDPDFQQFRDAALSPDWKKNVIDLVEQKIEENSED